jgi:flavin reductase (DIM6/NTAB) family NADH-FMN oxidoreductase RutF
LACWVVRRKVELADYLKTPRIPFSGQAPGMNRKEKIMKKVTLGPQTLLYPMPAVLVGAEVEGKANFMTAAWCGIAASSPPALAVGLQKVRHTLKGIEGNKTFSINVPSADQAEKVDFCGIYSGKKRDKSKIFQVFYGVLKNAPMASECPVNLECRLVHKLDLDSHFLFVGEIVETHVSDRCLTDGKADPAKVDPLVYTTGTMEYRRLGGVVARAFHVGKEA